jgi:heme/copper-type cytochrome/quinol oxidase subunit 2
MVFVYIFIRAISRFVSLVQRTYYPGVITVALVIGILAVLAVGLLYPSITNMAAFGQGAIQLSAKLVGSDFKWINSANGETNPTLMLKANSPQTIQIQNPTQAMHQLVIDFNGKQVATSGDIAAGSSGQLSFTPNQVGTFGYHCLYHPTTMKGIIQVQ